jgi:hypothetical protein
MMTLGKIFEILIFSSLAATGATLAGGISKNLANSKNLATSKNLASAKQVANVKADKEPLKGAAASVVHHVCQKLRSSWDAASAYITKPSCIT